MVCILHAVRTIEYERMANRRKRQRDHDEKWDGQIKKRGEKEGLNKIVGNTEGQKRRQGGRINTGRQGGRVNTGRMGGRINTWRQG